MKKILLIALALLICLTPRVLADKFVPEFDKMKTLRCNVEEDIFDKSGKVLVHNKFIRTYKLDDENSKIYLEKAPVGKIINYDENVIQFEMQNMTDDFIIQSKITINRNENTFSSNSVINYDDTMYERRTSKANGTCKYI